MFGTKTKFESIKTPLVLKNIFEKSDTREENKRFIAIEAINGFAFVFLIINDRIKTRKVQIKVDRIKPNVTLDVFVVNKKHKNAANEINPSKKSANNPDNSLNKAPVAAKMSGHECVNISKIIILPSLNYFCIYVRIFVFLF